MERHWKIAYAAALFNDLLDIAGIGSIPIIGDIIDLATSTVFWKILGRNYTLPTLLEFIPGVDILPIYTATATYAYLQREEQGENRSLILGKS